MEGELQLHLIGHWAPKRINIGKIKNHVDVLANIFDYKGSMVPTVTKGKNRRICSVMSNGHSAVATGNAHLVA